MTLYESTQIEAVRAARMAVKRHLPYESDTEADKAYVAAGKAYVDASQAYLRHIQTDAVFGAAEGIATAAHRLRKEAATLSNLATPPMWATDLLCSLWDAIELADRVAGGLGQWPTPDPEGDPYDDDDDDDPEGPEPSYYDDDPYGDE